MSVYIVKIGNGYISKISSLGGVVALERSWSRAYPMQKFTEAKQVADKWDGRIVMVNDPVEVRDEE